MHFGHDDDEFGDALDKVPLVQRLSLSSPIFKSSAVDVVRSAKSVGMLHMSLAQPRSAILKIIKDSHYRLYTQRIALLSTCSHLVLRGR